MINVQIMTKWCGIVWLPSRRVEKCYWKVKAKVEAKAEMKKQDLRSTLTSTYLAR
jgi:hypothetical protein